MVEKFEGIVLIIPCSNNVNPVKYGEFHNIELEIAKENGINLKEYEYLKHIPGLTDRGRSSLPGPDGYELWLIKKNYK